MAAGYTDARGQVIQLGAVLGRGGEATVYEVVGQPRVVAKMFAEASAVKAQKLQAMLSTRTPPASVCAWPITTLHSGRGSWPVGYLMSRIETAFPLDSLISPVQRKRDLPNADWRFIVHAARNLADGVAEIHRHGYVVGDLNENNVWVTTTGEIRFIDCDSFQIPSGSQVLRCEVATLLFWPPELQGMNAGAIDRTPNHDAFALGVLLFCLLFVGRHPFAGRYLGRGDTPDIPGLIAQHRFAFGARATERDIAPPPNALRLGQLPGTLGALFERAFAPEAVRGGRPTPAEWVAGLEALRKELVRCATFSAHWFPRSAAACPWCMIEGSAGMPLFISPQTPGVGTAEGAPSHVDVDALWRAVAAVASPASTAQLLPEPPELKRLEAALPSVKGPERLESLAKLLWMSGVGLVFVNCVGRTQPDENGLMWGFVAFLVGRFLHWASGRWSTHIAQSTTPMRNAIASLRDAWNLGRQELDAAVSKFAAKREELARHRDEHKQLRSDFDAEVEVLRRGARAAQLHAHLQAYPLRNVRLPNIGDAVVRALEAYGVYTANDVEYDRVRYVKGIGPIRAKILMQWKGSCEASFTFDPKRHDPAEYARLRHKYITRHQFLVGSLELGPMRLKATREQIDHLANDRVQMLRGLIMRAQRTLPRA